MADLDLVFARLVPPPEDFSIDAWARRLEHFEGRAIFFLAFDFPPGFFGARIIVDEPTSGPDDVVFPMAEYIFFADSLSPVHTEHVKAHELAHIALGHPTLVLPAGVWHEPSILTESVERNAHVCCRAAIDTQAVALNPDPIDQQAEDLTRMVYERVLTYRRLQSGSALEQKLQHLGIS